MRERYYQLPRLNKKRRVGQRLNPKTILGLLFGSVGDEQNREMKKQKVTKSYCEKWQVERELKPRKNLSIT